VIALPQAEPPDLGLRDVDLIAALLASGLAQEAVAVRRHLQDARAQQLLRLLCVVREELEHEVRPPARDAVPETGCQRERAQLVGALGAEVTEAGSAFVNGDVYGQPEMGGPIPPGLLAAAVA
jgi:hypothetical protein